MTHAVVLCDRLIGEHFHLTGEVVPVVGVWPDGSPAWDLGPGMFVRRVFGSGDEGSPEVAELLADAQRTAHALGHVLNGGAVVLNDMAAHQGAAAVERWLSRKATGHAIEAATYIEWVQQIIAARIADLVQHRADLGAV